MNLPSRANFHLSSEVLLMFFHRCENTKVSLEPFGIVVLNKVFNHGNQACSIGETFPVIPFSFQNSPESFHGPVINTLGNSGHALGHSGFGQHAVERTVGVLVSLIESVLKQFRIILPVLIDDVRILVSYHLGLSMTGIALDRLYISQG